MLCTNTMHRVADQIPAATDVPFPHIADATADRIAAQGAALDTTAIHAERAIELALV